MWIYQLILFFLAHRRRCGWSRSIPFVARVLSEGLPLEAVHRVPRARPLQLPHHRLLLLDGHHRPGPHVQEADPADSEGRRLEIENLEMCCLHAATSRNNVGAWWSNAKSLQQASRVDFLLRKDAIDPCVELVSTVRGSLRSHLLWQNWTVKYLGWVVR